MRKFFNFFFLVMLISTGAQADTPAQLTSVREILHQIPKEDYVALERLFRHLVFESYFAYTLFGSKPMTHRGAFLDALERSDAHSGDYIFLTDWKVWKKYAELPEFHTPNFTFVENTLQNPALFEVHFLSRKSVMRCVQKHIKTFREILGNDVTPEGIYEKMAHAEDLFEVLGESQVLYGILFGFGEKNSRGFYEKFFLELPLPDPVSFNDEEPKPNRLTLPYFQTFSERERKELKNTYQSERRHILSLYAKGNFLEITLTRLISPS